jgi:alginate O-acetyltransferase complex protein AlgI
MLFNSLEFALFFPIVTLLFFMLPHKFRWLLLLLASCFFYMFFKPIYILILILTIVIDYYAGIWIGQTEDKRKRKQLLLLSIIANVGVLVVFKYYNFLVDNINVVMDSMHTNGKIPLLNIILPIGLSFHTFQAMSYTIEVYRGNQKPEKHFGIYALYVMFYPQLVAGPIERPQNVLHQFHEKKTFNYDNFKQGLILMAWGLFKKCVIADRLSVFVNNVYGNAESFNGIPVLISICFFSLQIFCDFSGYSDIALGSAKCMGFDLMLNFDRPYLATTISEFWKRWHISLSTWFRDYLYIPLGGNKVSKTRWYCNLLIVFTVSGIWHGANYTFIIWGFLHGMYLIVENIFYKNFKTLQEKKSTTSIFIKQVVVFFLASFAWIFFRAKNVSDAFYLIKNAFVGLPSQIHQIISNQQNARLRILYINNSFFELATALVFILILVIIHRLQKNKTFDEWLIGKSKATRWALYYFLIISFICFGVFNKSEFIYFQF